jgi:hypothetical protein
MTKFRYACGHEFIDTAGEESVLIVTEEEQDICPDCHGLTWRPTEIAEAFSKLTKGGSDGKR